MRKFKLDQYFILYANCVPVKGAARSLICDLQKGRYYYIPNGLVSILQHTKTDKLEKIYEQYDSSEHETLDEYFNFLFERGLGFFDTTNEGFVGLSMEWDFPGAISNSIVDLDEEKMKSIDYSKFFRDLSSLNCNCVQLRCFQSINVDSLKLILNYTLDSRLREIRLVLKYNLKLFEVLRNDLLVNHKRISQVIFFGAETDSSESVLGVQFYFLTKTTLNESSCGNICRANFSPTIEHFTESLKFNSCLNRKLSLDSSGNIKNCPSQEKHFGNILNTDIKDVVRNDYFRSLWTAKKDNIQICRDCEYRYICTDCRVFVQDVNNAFSKPSKCKYDPYTATWG